MAIRLASLCKYLEMFCPAGTEIWPKVHIYGKVKVIHKGHRIFASACCQTLLSKHKKFDGDIIVSFLRYSVAKNDNLAKE